MSDIKNSPQEQATDLNKTEQSDRLNKENYKTKDEATDLHTKEGALKPTHTISKNIHAVPADEQQFENE